MFRDLPSYVGAKSSAFWQTRVPESWQEVPGLAVVKENRHKNADLAEKQVLSLSFGNVVVKPVEMQRGLVPESYEGYQVLEPGDIVIRPTDLQNDQRSIRVGFVKERGIITSAYIGLHATGDWEPEYAYLYLSVVDSSKRIYGMGSGLRQQLGWADIKRIPCLVPPRDEQAAIVKYLAHANARINKAIAAKRLLIALLDEKLRIDSAAVFSQVDVNDAPALPLKRLVKIRGGMTPSKENHAYWGGKVPWVSPKDVKSGTLYGSIDRITDAAVEETSISLVSAGAVVVVVRGMILARTVPTAVLGVDATLNQDMKALIPRAGVMEPRYLRDWLHTHTSELLSVIETAGHGTKKLDTSTLMNLRVRVPGTEIQREVCTRVDDEARATRLAIGRVRDEIALLQEFRTRLVADVVTGQVDVRAVAATLPDVVEVGADAADEVSPELDEELVDVVEGDDV